MKFLIVFYLILFFNISFVFSQNIFWEKVIYPDTLSSIISYGISEGNEIYLSEGNGPIGNSFLGTSFFQIPQYRFLKLNKLNGNLLQKTRYFDCEMGLFLVDEDTFYAINRKNGLFNLSKIYLDTLLNNYSFSSVTNYPGFVFFTDSCIGLLASDTTRNLSYFQWNKDLNLINRVIINYDSINQVGLYYGYYDPPLVGLTKLHFSQKSKKYWFSGRLHQIILDSMFKPIQVTMANTYRTYSLFDVKMNSNYDISCFNTSSTVELENGSIITACCQTRTYLVGSERRYRMRITKWNEDYDIIDSLEVSYDSNYTSYPIISEKSISYKGNPKEIYVSYTYDSLYSMLEKTMVIVAKIDSNLNLHWQKAFTHPVYRFMSWGIEALEGGGAVIYGGLLENPTNPPSPIFSAGYIIRIDSSGSISSTSDPLMQIYKDYVMYPNPAKDYVWFQSQKPNQLISIRIYDIHGKLMYQKEKFQEEQINISEWSKGMYFYQIECENRVSNGKILKE